MRRGLVVLIVYFAVIGYAPLRIATAAWPEWHPNTLEWLAFLVLPALGWLAHQWRRNALTRGVLRFVYTWLGMCFLLLFLVLPIVKTKCRIAVEPE